MAKPDAEPGNSQFGVSILIDGATCFASRRQLTGAELRGLPNPPIGSDRDLWLDVDGGLDKMIEPGENIALRPQMRFFSVPRVINPGSPA